MSRVDVLPFYPFTDCNDERSDGVVLLDHNGDCKTTAELRGDAWRIVDWEVEPFDGVPHWFCRSWHTVSKQHVELLARVGGAA